MDVFRNFCFDENIFCYTKPKEKEQKKAKKKSKCGCRESFLWFAANFLVLRSFQGANTACRSVTVCGAVWASRGASSFKCGARAQRTAAEVASPEWSAAKSHTLCIHFLRLILAFFLFCTCPRAHACMMFTTYFFVFLHRRESESLPTVNATIHHCVMCRAVESAVCERPFVVVSVFSRPSISGVLSSTYILILPTFA